MLVGCHQGVQGVAMYIWLYKNIAIGYSYKSVENYWEHFDVYNKPLKGGNAVQ